MVQLPFFVFCISKPSSSFLYGFLENFRSDIDAVFQLVYSFTFVPTMQLRHNESLIEQFLPFSKSKKWKVTREAQVCPFVQSPLTQICVACQNGNIIAALNGPRFVDTCVNWNRWYDHSWFLLGTRRIRLKLMQKSTRVEVEWIKIDLNEKNG